MDACVECCDCGQQHSATSAHYDMAIDNNGTWSDAFQYGDPTDTTWTLNGATFALQLQVTYYDAVPKLSLTSASGQIIVDDPIQRVIHLNVPPATVQSSLTPGTYVYDLLMTLNGVVTPLQHGAVCVSQGVTGV